MGTGFMKNMGGAKRVAPSGLNLESRAIGAGASMARSAGGGAAKALGGAKPLYNFKPLAKTSAVAAPGPKKI